MRSDARRIEPSIYQRKILDWVVQGRGNALVEAVAGSGKTSTLELLWNAVNDQDGEAIFLAFNRAIADELKERLEGLRASTIHALGYRLLQKHLERPVKLEGGKYRQLAMEILIKRGRVKRKELAYVARDLHQLVDLTRITLTDPRDVASLRALVRYHQVERYKRHSALLDKSLELVPEIMERGLALAEERIIDYLDMIWVPVRLGLGVSAFRWIFVDEAQDLNAAQLELVAACLAENGRVVFVGDPAQAIYGFQGADPQSMNRIAQRFHTTRLPLSISYRCPQSHVKAARRIMPEIEARENAPEGILSEVRIKDAIGVMRGGDLVLCRNRMPLLHVWNELRLRYVDAWVDVDSDTFRALRRRLRFYRDCKVPPDNLHDTLEEDASSATENDDEELASQLWLLHALTAANFSDYDELLNYVASAFTKVKDGVRCMTIHGAKGLEANRVFLIGPGLLPDPRATDWQYVQEENLLYVALTRSKSELYLCHGYLPGELKPSEPRRRGALGTSFVRLRSDP